jgi:uncharacterized protein (UPF0264 family)
MHPGSGLRLLVSVKDAAEAGEALAGGADIVDAKEPSSGALGAVAEDVLLEIASVVGGSRPLTAALGDITDAAAAEHAACVTAAAGAAIVKVGFAGVASPDRIGAIIASAGRGARAGSDGRSAVVAVGYADADALTDLAPQALIEIAARAGAAGVLIDTMNKDGPGLTSLMSQSMLAEWVAAAHEAGLIAALAGRLTAEDLAAVRRAGADIAGVRGAACNGGRDGRLSAVRVQNLHGLLTSDQDSSRPGRGGPADK